jgi:hypothetical protein
VRFPNSSKSESDEKREIMCMHTHERSRHARGAESGRTLELTYSFQKMVGSQKILQKVSQQISYKISQSFTESITENLKK